MTNYIPGGQKRDKIVAKRERTLIGAIKRGEPAERLHLLAEKVRDAKISACGEKGDRASSKEKWESYTPEEIIRKYRSKSEEGAARLALDAARAKCFKNRPSDDTVAAFPTGHAVADAVPLFATERMAGRM